MTQRVISDGRAARRWNELESSRSTEMVLTTRRKREGCCDVLAIRIPHSTGISTIDTWHIFIFSSNNFEANKAEIHLSICSLQTCWNQKRRSVLLGEDTRCYLPLYLISFVKKFLKISFRELLENKWNHEIYSGHSQFLHCGPLEFSYRVRCEVNISIYILIVIVMIAMS